MVRIKPPQIAWVLTGVSLGLHFALPKVYRGSFSCLACGVVLLALGFFVMTWAWWLFRRSGTPIRPTDRASSLVRSGPFRFSRNPMYLGMLAMLLGIALCFGSWPMLVGPVGFFAFMSLVFVPHEERMLRGVFGEDYTAYTHNVRRWL